METVICLDWGEINLRMFGINYRLVVNHQFSISFTERAMESLVRQWERLKEKERAEKNVVNQDIEVIIPKKK